MPYVVPRSGSSSWYYREAVPSDVEAIMTARTGRKPSDAMKSLRTTDKREAERRVVAVRARQHELWDEIRASSAGVPNMLTVGEMIELLTSHVYQGFIRMQSLRVREHVTTTGADFSRIASEKLRKRAQVALLPLPDDMREMERLAAAVSRKQCWSIVPGDGAQCERWVELVALVTKAVQIARSDLADLLDEKDAITEHAAVVERLGGNRASQPRAATDEDIMSLCAVYERERPQEGKRADTLIAERKIIAHFAKFVGESTAVTAIARSYIRDFKRALSDVPHKWSTREELKGMQLADAAKTWTAIGGATRSVTTVNREVSAVSAFFSRLKDNAYVEENVALGFRTRIDKSKNKFPPYSAVELRTLFSSPLFVGCNTKKEHLPGDEHIRDWRYWLPLCALYSGARAGEIAQLECSDVRELEGVWIFDFKEEGEGSAKRPKNKSSRRIVPVHDALIAFDLIDHVQRQAKKGHRLVFDNLEPGPRGD